MMVKKNPLLATTLQRGWHVSPGQGARLMGWVCQEKPRIHRQPAEGQMQDVFYLEPMKSYSVLTSSRQLGKRAIIYESVTCHFVRASFYFRWNKFDSSHWNTLKTSWFVCTAAATSVSRSWSKSFREMEWLSMFGSWTSETSCGSLEKRSRLFQVSHTQEEQTGGEISEEKRFKNCFYIR